MVKLNSPVPFALKEIVVLDITLVISLFSARKYLRINNLILAQEIQSIVGNKA